MRLHYIINSFILTCKTAHTTIIVLCQLRILEQQLFVDIVTYLLNLACWHTLAKQIRLYT